MKLPRSKTAVVSTVCSQIRPKGRETNPREIRGDNMPNVKSTINVKIDADVKETAAALLARMGMDQTTAIDMFYRKIIATKTLPFQPEPLPTDSDLLLAAIKSKNIPHKSVEVNTEGHIIANQDKDPELFDWAVNG